MSTAPPEPLVLPQVTLIAVTSVNLGATIAALEASMSIATFGAAKLLSDQAPEYLPVGLEWVPISPLISSRAYSNFVLENLADYFETSHCLVVQWDGYPHCPDKWQAEFLQYDYIGASWPQFGDGYDVGNGGFSMRSRDLMDACRSASFISSHPEDIAICRDNRQWLEAQGLRFAPSSLADAFSAERASDPAISFGFHGVWHMPRILGVSKFWQIYEGLDERASVRHDFFNLFGQIVRGRGGVARAFRIISDWVRHKMKRYR